MRMNQDGSRRKPTASSQYDDDRPEEHPHRQRRIDSSSLAAAVGEAPWMHSARRRESVPPSQDASRQSSSSSSSTTPQHSSHRSQTQTRRTFPTIDQRVQDLSAITFAEKSSIRKEGAVLMNHMDSLMDEMNQVYFDLLEHQAELLALRMGVVNAMMEFQAQTKQATATAIRGEQRLHGSWPVISADAAAAAAVASTRGHHSWSAGPLSPMPQHQHQPYHTSSDWNDSFASQDLSPILYEEEDEDEGLSSSDSPPMTGRESFNSSQSGSSPFHGMSSASSSLQQDPESSDKTTTNDEEDSDLPPPLDDFSTPGSTTSYVSSSTFFAGLPSPPLATMRGSAHAARVRLPPSILSSPSSPPSTSSQNMAATSSSSLQEPDGGRLLLVDSSLSSHGILLRSKSSPQQRQLPKQQHGYLEKSWSGSWIKQTKTSQDNDNGNQSRALEIMHHSLRIARSNSSSQE